MVPIILKAVRGFAWGLLAAFAIHQVVYTEGRFMHLDGAPQQCALAAISLVELIAAYIVARAIDRILDMAGQRKVRLEALPEHR